MAKYYYHKYNKSYYIKGVYYKDIKDKILKEYSRELRIIELENLKMLSNGVIGSKNMVEETVYLTYAESAGWNENQNTTGTDTYALINGKSYYLGRFTRKNFTHGKSNFIETIKAEEGIYPTNGLHTDGYWYVKGDKATIPINTNINGKFVESDSGHINVNGVWKEIKEMHQLQNGNWVKLF